MRLPFDPSIPFLQRRSAGVYFSEQRVWWVTFSRIGSHVRLGRVEQEPILDSSQEKRASEGALRRLTRRVRPSSPQVATHLGPASLREWTFKAPRFDDPAARSAWVRRQVLETLPAGIDLGPFALRHRVLRRARGSEILLAGAARREALRRRQALLASAGLEAASLGSLAATVGLAYGFSPAFAQGRAAAILLTSRAGTDLAWHEEGRLQGTCRLPACSGEPEALLESATRELEAEGLSAESTAFYAAGEAAWQFGEGPSGEPAGEHLPVSTAPLLPDSGRLPAAAAPAAGLALKALYEPRRYQGTAGPEADQSKATRSAATRPKATHAGEGASEDEDYDFLPRSQREAAHAAADKRDAWRATLAMGLAAALLVALPLAGTAWLEARVAEAQSSLAASAGDAERLQAITGELELLGGHLEATRSLVARRTRAAALLSRIGQATPEPLWLTDVALEEDPSAGHGNPARQGRAATAVKTKGEEEAGPSARSGAALALSGLSLSEAAVARLVARLEQSRVFSGVRLSLVEELPREAAREEGASGRALFRFEASARAPLTSSSSAPAGAAPAPGSDSAAGWGAAGGGARASRPRAPSAAAAAPGGAQGVAPPPEQTKTSPGGVP